jgi:hypothetical protein
MIKRHAFSSTHPVVFPSKPIKAVISKSTIFKKTHINCPAATTKNYGFPYRLIPKITLFQGLFCSKLGPDGLYATEPENTQKPPIFLVCRRKSKTRKQAPNNKSGVVQAFSPLF